MNGKQPNILEYNGNGYGYPRGSRVGVGTLTRPICGESWLISHYRKYPNGKLPEQGMIRGKVK